MKVNLHATAIAHRRRAISTNRSLEEVRRDAKTTFSAVCRAHLAAFRPVHYPPTSSRGESGEVQRVEPTMNPMREHLTSASRPASFLPLYLSTSLRYEPNASTSASRQASSLPLFLFTSLRYRQNPTREPARAGVRYQRRFGDERSWPCRSRPPLH